MHWNGLGLDTIHCIWTMDCAVISWFEFKRVHFRCACSILFFSIFLLSFWNVFRFVKRNISYLFGRHFRYFILWIQKYKWNHKYILYVLHPHAHMMLPNLRDMIPVFTPSYKRRSNEIILCCTTLLCYIFFYPAYW